VPTSLTIQSHVNVATVDLPDWLVPGQGFIYHIRGKADTPVQNYSVTVAVPVGESVTILGLPIGEYTITVESDWSWRYSESEQSQDVELTLESSDVTAHFNYGPPETDTDNGYYYMTSNNYNRTQTDGE
jgi:hypothetical protein